MPLDLSSHRSKTTYTNPFTRRPSTQSPILTILLIKVSLVLRLTVFQTSISRETWCAYSCTDRRALHIFQNKFLASSHLGNFAVFDNFKQNCKNSEWEKIFGKREFNLFRINFMNFWKWKIGNKIIAILSYMITRSKKNLKLWDVLVHSSLSFLGF